MAEIQSELRFWPTFPNRGHFNALQDEVLPFIHQSHKPFVGDATADNKYRKSLRDHFFPRRIDFLKMMLEE